MFVALGKHNDSFYRYMKYPIPTSFENGVFSWKEKNPLLDEYLEYIDSLSWVYQSIPFVKAIYLCNSLTFNALHDDSDIDVFIVAEEGKIRTVKFLSMCFFGILGAKRSLKGKRKKICLSFFVTQHHQNLMPISLMYDPYLVYWIWHLVPLYLDSDESLSHFYHQNHRIHSYVPFDEQQHIFVGNTCFEGRTRFKRSWEFIFLGWLGTFFEWGVKMLQLISIRVKCFLHPLQNKEVVISDVMLKFHQDIRQKVSEELLKKVG